MSEDCYDIFISWAHADGEENILQIKREIVENYKLFAPDAEELKIFTDHAIEWGDAWEAKIAHAISHSDLFITILSPSYFKSDFCAHEMHLWKNNEIQKGMLNKASLPVYYIELSENPFETKDIAVKEAFLQQSNEHLKPWFNEGQNYIYGEEIKKRIANELTSEKLDSKLQKIRVQNSSFTNTPKPNRDFVGRVSELTDIRTKLAEMPERIPLLHGAAGVGKTEIAFAYSYAYASEYPGGRFLIKSEGIKNIPDAFSKLVEDSEMCEQLGINPQVLTDDQKRNPEKLLKDIIRPALLKKDGKERGRVLIILDNVDEPYEMLNTADIDRHLSWRTGEAIHIIATTRKDTLKAAENEPAYPYPINDMSEYDALELLQTKRHFDTEDEKEAAKEIIDFIGGNAWALSMIAESLKHNSRYSYRRKADSLKQLKNVEYIREKDTRVKTRHGAINTEDLLTPTLELLSEEERAVADWASLLHPDYVYMPWLKEMYMKAYEEGEDTQDAEDDWLDIVEKLTQLHILSGTDAANGCARMHRLTGYVLRKSLEDNGLKKYKISEVAENISLILQRMCESLRCMLYSTKIIDHNIFDQFVQIEKNCLQEYSAEALYEDGMEECVVDVLSAMPLSICVTENEIQRRAKQRRAKKFMYSLYKKIIVKYGERSKIAQKTLTAILRLCSSSKLDMTTLSIVNMDNTVDNALDADKDLENAGYTGYLYDIYSSILNVYDYISEGEKTEYNDILCPCEWYIQRIARLYDWLIQKDNGLKEKIKLMHNAPLGYLDLYSKLESLKMKVESSNAALLGLIEKCYYAICKKNNKVVEEKNAYINLKKSFCEFAFSRSDEQKINIAFSLADVYVSIGNIEKAERLLLNLLNSIICGMVVLPELTCLKYVSIKGFVLKEITCLTIIQKIIELKRLDDSACDCIGYKSILEKEVINRIVGLYGEGKFSVNSLPVFAEIILEYFEHGDREKALGCLEQLSKYASELMDDCIYTDIIVNLHWYILEYYKMDVEMGEVKSLKDVVFSGYQRLMENNMFSRSELTSITCISNEYVKIGKFDLALEIQEPCVKRVREWVSKGKCKKDDYSIKVINSNTSISTPLTHCFSVLAEIYEKIGRAEDAQNVRAEIEELKAKQEQK